MWCCGSWVLTKRDEQVIQTAQSAMSRRLVNTRKKADETVAMYSKRAYTAVAEVREKWHIQSWNDIIHAKHFEWAGHTARIGQYDPNRLTARILKWKHYSWLDALEAQYGPGRQNHARRLRVWRWERQIQKYWGRGKVWQTEAQDRDNWAEHVIKV